MKTASGKAGAVQFAVEECPVKLAKIDYRSKKARNTRHARGHLQHKAMGEALRAERAALGMTQAKLAAAAGVPRQRISEIERGENVTALLLLRVLAAMGKGLRIVDVRPTAGDLRSLFEEDRDAP